MILMARMIVGILVTAFLCAIALGFVYIICAIFEGSFIISEWKICNYILLFIGLIASLLSVLLGCVGGYDAHNNILNRQQKQIEK